MIAATTLGCEWPTFKQPTPPDRSRKVLPSTSVSNAPSARCTTAGRCMPIALATYADFSASNALDFGPGITWVMVGALDKGGPPRQKCRLPSLPGLPGLLGLPSLLALLTCHVVLQTR